MGDRSFDSIVIGAGQAGPSLAVTLAKRGEKVALIEAERLGGTCINNGCTPTKTLRKSARVAYIARRAAEFGVHLGKQIVQLLCCGIGLFQPPTGERTAIGQHGVFDFCEKCLVACAQCRLKRLKTIQVSRQAQSCCAGPVARARRGKALLKE